MIEDQRQPMEDDMAKKGFCANPACKNHAKRVTLYSQHNLCWDCHKAALAGNLEWPPKIGREETPATPEDAAGTVEVSGRVEPFEKIEELPVQVEETLDPSKPFSLAGFEFDPKVFAKPLSPATVHISKSGNLHISRGAFVAFDLGRFVAVSMVPSRDKRALALVFSTTDIKGYRHLTPDHSSTCNPKASAREVIRVWPEVVGQKLLMRETLAAGAFVAVLDGEAA